MNIILVGGGKVGLTIIESLVREKHDVVVVDSNPQVVSQVSGLYDVMSVCGNGVDWETLMDAGVEKANLLIAVTGSDEFNMLCCIMAKNMGVPYTLARIRNPEYNDRSLGFIKQSLGVSFTINPDAVAAKEMFNLLQLPDAESIETFSRRNFELIELVVRDDSPLCGMTLMEMKKRFPASYLVGIVQRGDTVTIPDGSFRLQSGDRIGLTATAQELGRLLRLIGSTNDRAKNVMLVGAGRYAFYLAKMLLAVGSSVTVIDKDRAACDAFAEALPGAIVSCFDAANEDLLLEEGLHSMDAFVTLTGNDQENILLSYLALGKGVKKVITKLNRKEFLSMAEKLGLECIVSPRHMISDILTRYARALDNSMGSKIETLYQLMGGKAEALEFIVAEDFPLCSTPLKDMKLKGNILLAGILRGRKVIIPAGADTIEVGDRVVVLSAGNTLTDLRDIVR